MAAPGDGARIVAVAALVYVGIHLAVLLRRTRQLQVENTRSEKWAVFVLMLASLAAIIATVATGSIGAFEALLLVLLARPMLAFLFVLASFRTS